MELPHVRRANDPAELLRLLRDWEAGGCASALSRLFVLFAAGHPWGTEAAEEVLLPRLPSAGCLITVAFSLSDKHATTPELAALFPEVVGGGKEPVLVRVGPTGSGPGAALLSGSEALRPDSAELATFLGEPPVSAEVAAYRRDGISVHRNVLSPALLEECRRHVDWLAEQNPGVRPEHFSMMYGDPFWHRLVSDPILLDIAAQYVGPDIALFQTHWIAKPPLDGMPVLYHQDGER
jgi:hypothetical protein